MAYRCVDQLIYPRKEERIFQTSFVQVYEVYAYPPLLVLLLYHHGVGQPFGVKYFLDIPRLFKFSYLIFNSFITVFGWAPGWLLSRSDWWVNIQVMTDKVRINSWASQASQANMSTFFQMNSISACFSWGGNCTPTWKNFSKSVSMITFSKSSQLASSADPPSNEAKALDCYKGFSTKSKGVASGLCKMAATMHCLATD